MFTRIEHIANNAGRFLLQVLFIISVGINCLSCAKYFLSKKENFQFPICSYFKELKNPVFRVSFKDLGVFDFSIQKGMLPLERNVDNVNIVVEQNVLRPNKNQIDWKLLCWKLPTIVPKQTTGFNDKPKLYLLYKQLKVGDDILHI